MFQPSMLCLVALNEKFAWSGMPVVIDNWSDWVVSVPVTPAVLAKTRSGVFTVPELTVTKTCPVVASEIAVAEVVPLAKVIPPAIVLNEKLTVFPPIGLPPVSTTLKTT